MAAIIRMATEQDAASIAALYAPYVRETTISFETEAPSTSTMRRRLCEVSALFPWLVCENGAGSIVGYAYACEHRDRAAYQWSVDAAVYVDAQAQRLGVGRGLYTALFQLLRLQGFFNVYAGVTLPNAASVELHEAMGFEPVGVYRSAGFKLGGWHDVAWWRLALQPAKGEPAMPQRPRDLVSEPAWSVALREGATRIRL